MKLEEAIKIIKDIDVLDDMELQEAYETVLQELEHLQKENEELKTNLYRVNDKNIKHLVFIRELQLALKNSISKDKIREKIEEYKVGVDCTYCNNTCSRYILCTNLQDLLKEE